MQSKMLILCILFSTLPVLAEKLTPEQRLEMLKKKKNLTLEDFEHENPGCPENSDCTENMGKQRTKWLDFTKKIDSKKIKEAELVKQLEEYRKIEGLPVSFYTNNQAMNRFSPIIFESACAHHNPKKKDDQILMAEAFMVDTKNQEATIKLMDTTHKIPLGELVTLDTIYLYSAKNPKGYLKFQIPRGEKPIYVQGDEVTLLREQGDLYYGLAIKTDGSWRVTSIKTRKDLGISEYNAETECPKLPALQKEIGDGTTYKRHYADSFCQSLINLESKGTTAIMRLPWSC